MQFFKDIFSALQGLYLVNFFLLLLNSEFFFGMLNYHCLPTEGHLDTLVTWLRPWSAPYAQAPKALLCFTSSFFSIPSSAVAPTENRNFCPYLKLGFEAPIE